MTLGAHGRTYVQPDWQAYWSNLANARYEILDIREIARNAIVVLLS